MKLRKLFWIGVLFLPLLSCDEPDNVVETEATLELSIPLYTADVKGLSSESTYSFFGSTTFCLANKDNAKACPNNIVRIAPGDGAELSLSNVYGVNSITLLELEWGFAPTEKGSFSMQTPVRLTLVKTEQNELVQEFDLDEVLFPLIDRMNLDHDLYYKIMIRGKADRLVSSEAKIEVPILVEHEWSSPRYSLF